MEYYGLMEQSREREPRDEDVVPDVATQMPSVFLEGGVRGAEVPVEDPQLSGQVHDDDEVVDVHQEHVGGRGVDAEELVTGRRGVAGKLPRVARVARVLRQPECLAAAEKRRRRPRGRDAVAEEQRRSQHEARPQSEAAERGVGVGGGVVLVQEGVVTEQRQHRVDAAPRRHEDGRLEVSVEDGQQQVDAERRGLQVAPHLRQQRRLRHDHGPRRRVHQQRRHRRVPATRRRASPRAQEVHDSLRRAQIHLAVAPNITTTRFKNHNPTQDQKNTNLKAHVAKRKTPFIYKLRDPL